MQNKIQDGTRILITNSGGTVIAGGTLVMVGEVAAVASKDIQPGETESGEVGGVFSLPADGAAIAQGVGVYLADGKVTATVGAVYVGKAWAAAAAGAATVAVNINF